MSIALVTDSTCDLPVSLVKERQIFVVPQQVIWGTQVFLDGVELSVDDFYKRLATDKVLPKTSQPTVGDFVKAYQQARVATNAEAVVCVTLSADLSGTYNSAIQALNQVDFPVYVIDTRTASLPLGFLALTAADARDQGLGAEAIVEAVMAELPNVNIYFTLSTLEFLHRGGRIGAAKRFIGDTFNIRPILYVADGKIAVKESVRTRSKGLKRLVELLDETRRGRIIKRLGVIHGVALAEAEELAQSLKDRFQVKEVVLTSCCSAVGVHVGPGVIGVVYQLT